MLIERAKQFINDYNKCFGDENRLRFVKGTSIDVLVYILNNVDVNGELKNDVQKINDGCLITNIFTSIENRSDVWNIITNVVTGGKLAILLNRIRDVDMVKSIVKQYADNMSQTIKDIDNLIKVIEDVQSRGKVQGMTEVFAIVLLKSI